MQKHQLFMVMLLSISPYVVQAETLNTTSTLQEVIQQAVATHPQLRMSQWDIEAAQAELSEQSAYAYNPELSLESQRRALNGGGNSDDYYISISHGVELGGKRGYREQVAQAALDARSHQAEVVRQQVYISAGKSFVQLYFAQNLLAIRSQQRDLLQSLSLGMQRKLAVGDANILDVNLASAAYASALSAATEAQQTLMLAQSSYALALASFTDTPHTLLLPQLDVDWLSPSDVETIALRSRADYAVKVAQVRQMDATAKLADSARIPDMTVSLMRGEEAGETLTTLGVSFPIPIWNSHSGAYRASLMQASRTQDELQWFNQQLKLEVQTAVLNHRSAMLALQAMRLTKPNIARLSNVALVQLAYQAGELSLEDLVIHINQALDARLTTLNIEKQAWLARIRLAQVLGKPEYMLQGVQ